MAKSVRRVVLGVTGSIAAYKAPAIVRGFVKKGVEVRCVLTPNAAHFVAPLTLATLSKNPVAQTLHDVLDTASAVGISGMGGRDQ